MKQAILALACQFLSLNSTSAFLDEYRHDRGVVILNKSNMKDLTDKFDYSLVEFARSTCKACGVLNPILQRLNQAFHKHLEFPIPVGRVTCDNQLFFCSNIHEITDYPTLRLYTNHKSHFTQYKGPIDLVKISSWVNDRVFNSFIRIHKPKHLENIKTALEHNLLVFIYFGHEGTENWKTFKNFAFTHTHSKFYWTDDLKTLEKWNVPMTDLENANKNGLVFVLKPHDEALELFDGQVSFDRQEDFYAANKEPSLWQWNVDFMKRFKDRGDRPIVVLLSRNTDEEILDEYLSLTHSYLGKEEAYFSHVDLTSTNLPLKAREIIETVLGVHWTDMPTLRAISPDKRLINWNQVKYPEKTFKFNQLKRFIRNLIKGNLPACTKSQPLPEISDDGKKIQVVVRDNFDAEVTKSEQHVVVFLSAEEQWCKSCAGIEELLEAEQRERSELGEGGSKIKFVKYDVNRNELDEWMFVLSGELLWFDKDGGNEKNLTSMHAMGEDITEKGLKEWISEKQAGEVSGQTDL